MKIKELIGTDIQIGEQVITGFIRDQLCDKCSTKLIYNDTFDSDLCPSCNEWKESECEDRNCDICVGKPKIPLSYLAMQPNMHITYKNISEVIDQVFPEYTKWKSYDPENRELPYIHLATFAMEILDNLDNQEYYKLAVRLLQFTNFIINNYGDDLHNLFGIEVFENLTGSRQGAHLANEYLTGKALESFHETTRAYHTAEFLDEYFQVFNRHPILADDPASIFSYMLNKLKRPGVNSPDLDSLLWEIRTDLMLDEELLAGTMSYYANGKNPPDRQPKQLRELHDRFKKFKNELMSHKDKLGVDQEYTNELINYIDDLDRLQSNASIWIWNNKHI
jgi:hypothetical protein